jgi:excisionase family DNA binding protein
MLTTAEVAAALQVTRRRVLELIRLGTLKAEKFGRDWQVDSASVEAYKNSPRKPGPKKKNNPKPGAIANSKANKPQTANKKGKPL